MPAYVNDGEERYRPEILLWMNFEGAILGSQVAKPGELLPMACEGLQRAMEAPMIGRPHTPKRVRVASPKLAEVLRAGHPGLDIVCAPTPELDQVIDALCEQMGEAAVQSYLSPDVGPEAVASFFRAAAGLFRAKPWKVVPSDQLPISVSIETLGIRGAAMSVIGQMGESLGFVLFSDLEDFGTFLHASDAIECGEEPEIPPHLAFNYDRGADLAPGLRKEIAKHEWEVVDATAYPWLIAVDEDLVARPPTSSEVRMAEAIARALSNLVAEKKALRAAWKGGEPVSRTFSVETHQGELQVTLRFPYTRSPVAFDPSDDLLAELAAVFRNGEGIDPDAREMLEDELMGRFALSPEAEDLDEIQSCRLVLDLAADFFGETIANLSASQLREIIFDIIPRKVSVDASEARGIIEEIRAFYAFLKRAYKLKQADACLKVLGSNAIKRLEAALSDSSKFGMAKSLFLAGREAGFDMNSREGIETWMRAVEGKRLPESVPMPPVDPPLAQTSKKTAKTKKKKRKAARNARKRNR